MGYTVRIDVEECVSSGKCVADNPDAFGFDDDELAVLLPGASSLDDAKLLTAARRCPSGAILLLDDSGEPIET
ncbi:MAG: ferredoxin [Actinomycetia bacterium]|nr:ferredoxin [Actinomycetes bacterium]